jgi:hypothetical protein
MNAVFQPGKVLDELRYRMALHYLSEGKVSVKE